MGFVRSISLDKTTNAIADNIGNFSEFVRTMLLIHADKSGLTHTCSEGLRHTHVEDYHDKAHHVEGMCNPFHVKGRCVLCWPITSPIESHLMILKKKLCSYREVQGSCIYCDEGVEEE